MKSFEIFISEIIDKHGQNTLADKLDIDASTLSKFRSSQGTINLKDLEKILKFGDGMIMSRSQIRKLEDTVEVLSDLWKKSRKGNGNDKTRNDD